MSNKTRATISINKEIWDLLKLNFNCIFLKQTYKEINMLMNIKINIKNYMKMNYQIMVLKLNFYIRRSVVS